MTSATDELLSRASSVADPRGRRRWPWIVGGVLLVLIAAAAIGWTRVVPEWRPSLRTGERFGVDVSSHQGEIDWPEVAADDVEFAYAKATEGRDFTDRWLSRNRAGATAAGLDVGAYHYFTLCTPGAAQAEHFLRVAPPDPHALPPAVDLEDLTGACDPTPASVARELEAFVVRIEAAWGRRAVLYVGAGFEARFPDVVAMERDRWQRRLFRRPDVDDWSIWQFTGTGHVDGIDGPVDVDVARG